MQSDKVVSLYKVIPPLVIGGLVLLLSFYLCILVAPVYIYLLPVFSVCLFTSFYAFYRADKEIKNKNIKIAFPFYKGSQISYLVFFLYLLSVSFIFLPVYSQGGNFFIWFCAPLAVLCLAAWYQARKGFKKLTAEEKQLEKKIN